MCARPSTSVGPCLRARAREGGFSLVELLVAFVLLAIVGGLAVRAVMDGASGVDAVGAQSGGIAQAAEAADRFGSDLRLARAAGRSGSVVDRADLKAAVETGSPLTALGSGAPLDWRDLAEANATSVTFQADVIDDPGAAVPECVQWRVVTATGGWVLQRTTRGYSTGCAAPAGAVLERDDMTQPNTTTPAPTALFTYVVATPTTLGCTANVTSSPNGLALNRVTSVRIDFRSLAATRRARANAQLLGEIAIRSRDAADYRYAMGCSA